MNILHRLYRYARLKLNNGLIRILFRNTQPHKKYFLAVCAEDPMYYSRLTSKPRHVYAQINHCFCKSYEYFYNKKVKNGSLHEKIHLSMKQFFDVDAIADYVDYKITKYLVDLKTFDLNVMPENPENIDAQ